MAKRTIETQYARYLREYEKRVKRTEKYGLRPSRSKAYNLLQFETETLTLRHQETKVKDIAATIAKQQAQPFTELQVQNLMHNAIVVGPDGRNSWNPELNQLLNTLGLGGKYDHLLNDRSHDRTLKLTQMMQEVYRKMKEYLESHPGETEALGELIGEAFWGS